VIRDNMTQVLVHRGHSNQRSKRAEKPIVEFAERFCTCFEGGVYLGQKVARERDLHHLGCRVSEIVHGICPFGNTGPTEEMEG
jgi:hypothetical protein